MKHGEIKDWKIWTVRHDQVVSVHGRGVPEKTYALEGEREKIFEEIRHEFPKFSVDPRKSVNTIRINMKKPTFKALQNQKTPN